MFFLLILNLQAAITPKHMQKTMNLIMDCAFREQATQYDLDELFAHRPPTTKSAKCLHACINERLNLVSHFLYHIMEQWKDLLHSQLIEF